MHQQHFARRQLGQQVFCAAAERADRLALEPRGEPLWQYNAQVRTMRDHL
jgi:hypothetical protein